MNNNNNNRKKRPHTLDGYHYFIFFFAMINLFGKKWSFFVEKICEIHMNFIECFFYLSILISHGTWCKTIFIIKIFKFFFCCLIKIWNIRITSEKRKKERNLSKIIWINQMEIYSKEHNDIFRSFFFNPIRFEFNSKWMVHY